MGLKKNAYLLQVQFHFEIDALNTVSATFEITKIFSTLQVKLNILSSYHTLLQRICYSDWANGAQNGVISIGQWGVFNHEKGAIWQSHLAAQKEGVITAIIFSNDKTS